MSRDDIVGKRVEFTTAFGTKSQTVRVGARGKVTKAFPVAEAGAHMLMIALDDGRVVHANSNHVRLV